LTATILIVDDEPNVQLVISEFLTLKGYEVRSAENLATARTVIQHGEADIILLDVSLPDGYGPNLLQETSTMPARPPIIMITAFGDIEMAVDAMKNGAHDFLQKPIELSRLEQSIQRANEIVAMRRELAHLRKVQQQNINFIVGNTKEMQLVVSQAQRAAAAGVRVMITGENGTGKEVLAKHIHKIGARSSKPIIDINCAAIQDTMLESELFGYEARAFTGADDKKKIGLMEVADTGILFLDEVSSMSMDMQSKLLRAIEEQNFRRVGGTNLVRVDVQIISASNRNLRKMIEDGKFREDLFYRLNVVDLHLPPLRERKEDIPELVGYFIRNLNSRLGMNIQDITPNALQALINYRWPGNIRELSHAIERTMLFCDDPIIDINHLPPEFHQAQ
jgi:two-component system, NtrC family, response regulator AtoC